MDHDDKERIALWRLGVLGPLMSARLEHGDRRAYFEEAAKRTYEHPCGRQVRLSARTIEAWFYAYKKQGLAGLHPGTRIDRGVSRVVAPSIVDLLIRAKREKPSRSVRQLIRILERARRVPKGMLRRATVHRLLQTAGVSGRPRPVGAALERRSFLPEHAGDLWLGDAMHGPVAVCNGRPQKVYLLTQLDAATRFVVHSAFYPSETAVDHEHGLREAIMRHGCPRTYYVDLGAAYIAGSLRAICAELGIHLVHTAPRDCEAKGAIERWHRTWRAEVGSELPQAPLALEELNAKHWAWLRCEYHGREHDTTQRKPLEHILADTQHLRPVPRHLNLDEVFLHRVHRKVRKNGTVRFGGGFFEVGVELYGKTIDLRYDPKREDAAPKVYRDGRFYADTVPLDLYRNATRARRRSLGTLEHPSEPTGLDPLALLEQEHYARTHFDNDDGGDIDDLYATQIREADGREEDF